MNLLGKSNYKGIQHKILNTEFEKEFYIYKRNRLITYLIKYIQLNGFIDEIMAEVFNIYDFDLDSFLLKTDLHDLMCNDKKIMQYCKKSKDGISIVNKEGLKLYIHKTYPVSMEHCYTVEEKLRPLLIDASFFKNFIEIHLLIDKLELINEYLNIYYKYNERIKELSKYNSTSRNMEKSFIDTKGIESLSSSIDKYNESKVKIFDNIFEILEEITGGEPQDINMNISEYYSEYNFDSNKSNESFKEFLNDFLDKEGILNFKLIVREYLQADDYTIMLQYLKQIEICNKMLDHIKNNRGLVSNINENFVVEGQNTELELLMAISFKISKIIYKYNKSNK